MAPNTLEDLYTAKLNLELRVGHSTSPVGSVPSGNVPVIPSSQVMMQSSNNMINLPKLQIVKFDGDHRKWPQFLATFQHAIDAQPIADIEKVAYLLSYLEGEALEAVAGYTVASENHEPTKETLREKFGRPQILLNELYAELHNVQLPNKDNRDLAECVTSIERVLQQMQQMGEDIDNPQTELCIERRLPRWALLEIEQAKEADPN
ncbi:hypothetical protein AB6A40_008570 [Gnathostoma spinigerum]|uniref:Gag protein n=1 Tax=Gnathostoma spinigerum TaxID=75299 RepID=A0ABD6EPV3_9BILA